MAERKFEDNVPEKVKADRLSEIIDIQRKNQKKTNDSFIGHTKEVLIEGPSKKDPNEFCGRISENTMVIFPNQGFKAGQYVNVKITSANSATLKGEAVV